MDVIEEATSLNIVKERAKKRKQLSADEGEESDSKELSDEDELVTFLKYWSLALVC